MPGVLEFCGRFTVTESTNISSKLENVQKYENYREQFIRLDKALKAGFNLEAIFIEYAILGTLVLHLIIETVS